MNEINDTKPLIEHREQLKRFRNWEQGFDLYFKGATLEDVQRVNHKARPSRELGWRAAEFVKSLQQDPVSVAILKERILI